MLAANRSRMHKTRIRKGYHAAEAPRSSFADTYDASAPVRELKPVCGCSAGRACLRCVFRWKESRLEISEADNLPLLQQLLLVLLILPVADVALEKLDPPIEEVGEAVALRCFLHTDRSRCKPPDFEDEPRLELDAAEADLFSAHGCRGPSGAAGKVGRRPADGVDGFAAPQRLGSTMTRLIKVIKGRKRGARRALRSA